MSEYAGGERERGSTYAGTAARASVPVSTPAERAADAACIAAREVSSIERSVDEVAHATDPKAWAEKRAVADHAIVEAARSVERARRISTAAQLAQLDEQDGQLERARRRLDGIVAPPAFIELDRESDIRRIIEEPVVGPAKAGHDAKESALSTLFASLDPRTSRALIQRLDRNAAEDPIALGMGRWTAERRQRLRAVLAGADRRHAVAATRRPNKPEPAGAARDSAPQTQTDDYLRDHSVEAWRSIATHLQATRWAVADRCTIAAPRFLAALFELIHADALDVRVDRLAPLCFPHDVRAEIAELLPAPRSRWVPAIGMRLGEHFESALVASVERMTERYVDAADARAHDPHHRGAPVGHRELITSLPIDRLVARSLSAHDVAHVETASSPSPRKRTTLREVITGWQGATNPRLWNWVRADRDDATPEEVAASLFRYARASFGGDETSFFAYGLASAPPMFGLPASWAARFPEALATAPQAVKDGKIQDEGSDTIASRLMVLATTRAERGGATSLRTPSPGPAGIAARGTEGPGQPLPHLDRIQASFGSHDVSGIRAHVGGEAAPASRELGARAYAIGNDVAFASAPDLHTAAHEAAHVVEQTAGVALKGELDEPGDAHEQLADRVADAVVRGESAEPLLDRVAGRGGGAVVQRKTANDSNEKPRRSLFGMYLFMHRNPLHAAITRKLGETEWPDPAKDVSFADRGVARFVVALATTVAQRLDDDAAFRRIVHPSNIVAEFHRDLPELVKANLDGRLGSAALEEWSPAFGAAVARAVEEAVLASLMARVGPRYAEVRSRRGHAPDADDLTAGHPIDPLVAHALTQPGVIEVASVEPVAPPEPVSTPTVAQLMGIEGQIGGVLASIEKQIAPTGMAGALAVAYGARTARAPVLAVGDAKTRTDWLPVLQFQHTQLMAIASKLGPLVQRLLPLTQLHSVLLKAAKASERDQLHEMLTAYVEAAAVSHLRDQSTALLRAIAAKEHRAEVRAVDAAEADLEEGTREAIDSGRGAVPGTAAAAEQLAHTRQNVLKGRSDATSAYEHQRSLTLAGEFALRSRMRATERALEQLHAAAVEAFGDPAVMHKLVPKAKTYPEVIASVTAHLADVQQTWDAAARVGTAAAHADGNAPADWAGWQGRAAGLEAARGAFAEIAGDNSVSEFLNEARSKIKDQQFLVAVATLGAKLLLTFAAGLGAAALGKSVAGMLAGEASGFVMKAAAIGADLAINVTINSVVQLAQADGAGSLGWAMLENALMELFTRGIMGRMRSVEAAAVASSRELAQLPHLSAVERQAILAVDFTGANVMAEMVGGMASQWAANRLVHVFHTTGEQVAEPFAYTVLQQGAAIGLGRFFHGRLAAWHHHRDALAKTKIGQLPEALALFSAHDQFDALAEELAHSLSPDPAAMDKLLALKASLIEQEGRLYASHPEPVEIGGTDHPVRTPYGDVWPGEVPVHVPAETRRVFEDAKALYDGLKRDGFQGASPGRIRWTEYLVEHGIPVDGKLRFGGTHEIYEHAPEHSPPTPSHVAIPREASQGHRSENTGPVDKAVCLAALDELIARGTTLEGLHRHGDTIKVPLADGGAWTIKIAAPQPTAAGEMAALVHGERGDTVWVSATLTDEQVPRALGAILGESFAAAGRGRGDGRRFGELDAMLAHRKAVTEATHPELPAKPTVQEIQAHALAASRVEAVARIDAELDLVLSRMGVLEPGARRDEQLARMRPELASRVRERLAQREAIGFRPAAVIAENAVARPGEAPRTALGSSPVLPDAPAAVRAYNEGDRVRVLELRVELETLREIDARTAERDQPGTNGAADIAKGETRRRELHLARARALMSELQLGGDTPYLKARLAELAAVFPGVERDIAPAITERAARRDTAAAQHHEAEAFRTERAQQQQALTQTILQQKVITTKRLVVGDGFSGLADIASLGTPKTGAWTDPSELLVLGNPDLIAMLAARDPVFRWGQRAGVYDRPQGAHPAFSDADGHGTGELNKTVEDPGEFMHVGEVRDAMDLARKRLGIAAVEGLATKVEVHDETAGDPPWAEGVDPQQFSVRVRVTIGGQERFIYTERVDLTTGPGKPRAANQTILSAEDRKKLVGDRNGNGAMFSGERLLEGQVRSLAGKRVLVMSFGPTGAWVAVVAAQEHAARVDFSGAAGGEGATNMRSRMLEEWKKRKHAAGEAPPRDLKDIPSNESTHYDMAQLDRVQDAIDGNPNIHETPDRIVHIEPAGEGATVTFAHGPGENAELYQVHYDVIITNMGYGTNVDAKGEPGEPTVKEMIGNMKMAPQRGTRAPILEDSTGRVRIMGYAAGDSVNVAGSNRGAKPTADAAEFETRRKNVKSKTSADSPDDRVVEGVGMSSRMSNGANEGNQ